jgi:hypothetical protein
MKGSVKIDFTLSWSTKSYTAGNLNAHIDDTTYRFDSIHSSNFINISSIQYFISDISLVSASGSTLMLDDNGVHYIDLSVPSTLSWTSLREMPAGVYDSVVFFFGLTSGVSGYFTDPPESNMFWPEQLGGGYHFMKIDGRWKNKSSDTVFNTFGLHFKAEDGIRLSFPQRVFMTEMGVVNLQINMALDKWFNVPPTWDFNQMGGAIMQNSTAQEVLKDRVKYIFSVVKK